MSAAGGLRQVRPIPPASANRAYNYGGGTLGRATEGAVQAKNALGLPSYADLFKQVGGGNGTIEYGNAGVAGEGAKLARDELMKWRGDLEAQRRNIAAARGGVANPTRTAGFKQVMRLNNERAAAAAEDMDQEAARAASARGFAGGYNPARTERDRLETLAVANADAVGKEREAQLALLGAESDLYRTDVGGYGAGLGAYTDLTKTLAELPTKYLTAYSNLLGSMPNYGDFFGTALKGAMFEEEPERWRMQEQAQARADARKFGYGEQAANSAAAREEAAARSAYERQQAAERERQQTQFRMGGRDAYGRPYGSANPYRG